MPRTFNNIFRFFCLSTCLFAAFSCQNQTGNDREQLQGDARATAEINRINQILSSGQYLMKSDIDSLREIYEKYPHAPLARQIMQAALIRREDWQAAADFINRIPETEQTDEEKKNLAKIYLKLGRYEDAQKTIEPLLEKNSSNLDLVSVSASALFHLGRYAEAAERLDKSWPEIVGNKRSEEATIRGLIYFYQKAYPKAVETLNLAVEFNPENVGAYNGLARLHAARGEIAKAEEYTQKVQAIYDKVTAESQKKNKFVESARQLEEAFQAKRFAEVVEIAQEMLPEAENENKYALYQFLASAYQSLGKTAEAQKARLEAEKIRGQK